MKKTRGIVCYDAQCSLCTGFINRWRTRLLKAGFRLAPLQSPSIQKRLGISEVPDEMKLIAWDGKIIGGASAIIAIAESLGAPYVMTASARSPMVLPTLNKMYEYVARNRTCRVHG
jgi:predicted DCC family thiol-disulfide oxidoreductase YuxK